MIDETFDPEGGEIITSNMYSEQSGAVIRSSIVSCKKGGGVLTGPT